MSIRRFKPSGTFVLVVIALLVGLEAPAAAHQIAHKIKGSSLAKHSVAGNRLKNHTVGLKQLAPLHWHPLALTNGWSTYSGRRTPAYAIDGFGIVHLKGGIHCSPDGPNCEYSAFALPAAARPSTIIDVPTYAADTTTGEMYVDLSGHAYFYDAVDDSRAHVYTSLDGVSFAPH